MARYGVFCILILIAVGMTAGTVSAGNVVGYKFYDYNKDGVAGSNSFPLGKRGFCVSLRCERGRVAAIELHPYPITDQGLRRLGPREAQMFAHDLTKLSRPFRTAAGPARAWNAWLEYYGESGFRAEVTGILDRMASDPRKAAAMFRNRITTLQHVEHWDTFLTRMIDGGRRDHTRADYRLVEEYFSRTVN